MHAGARDRLGLALATAPRPRRESVAPGSAPEKPQCRDIDTLTNGISPTWRESPDSRRDSREDGAADVEAPPGVAVSFPPGHPFEPQRSGTRSPWDEMDGREREGRGRPGFVEEVTTDDPQAGRYSGTSCGSTLPPPYSESPHVGEV